ncbi:putative acetyltransferase [Rhodobiaceae bacterium]|nr:putative acetyltransferase [Rhodobiaceae bacterium]
MDIRPESACDEDAIYQLTRIAFEPMFFSDGSEAPLVGRLRNDEDLTISLVAEKGGEIVGHIAFSPATINGRHDGWFGLGPVSVHPDVQKQGIARALVETGLKMLEDRGATGCVLTGNPEIYSRLGFQSDGNVSYGTLNRQFIQWLVFSGPTPHGELKFAPAFGDEYPAE